MSDRILLAEERAVIDMLGEAWNAFMALQVLHADELPDFRKAIHDAQRIVMARPAQFDFNQEPPVPNPFPGVSFAEFQANERRQA